jgi:hypothetical protein
MIKKIMAHFDCRNLIFDEQWICIWMLGPKISKIMFKLGYVPLKVACTKS